MGERRSRDRRTNPAVPEPLERRKERRQGERRESLRRKAHVVVVDGGVRHEVLGELSLGGASFVLPGAPEGEGLEVELAVTPGRTLRLRGRVLAARAARTAVRHVRVAFEALDTRSELALAKWLDGVADDG